MNRLRTPVSRAAFRPLVWLALCAGVLTGGLGCAPALSVAANTEIRANGECQRSFMYLMRPHPHFPKQQVALENHLVLPDRAQYQSAEVTPTGVKYRGVFPDPDSIPVDFMKKTPGTDLLAENHLTVRVRDYALLTVIDYEERIEDIVERLEAEEHIDEATALLLNAFMGALNERFGAQYDLAELETWLGTAAPPFVKRLYSAYWEIRRSRRGGIHDDAEPREWEERFRQELVLLGIDLEPVTGASDEESNAKRLWAYVDGQLAALAKPRTGTVPPLTTSMFRDKKSQTEFLSILEGSLKKSFGTVDDFRKRMEPLHGAIFGAFTARSIGIEQREPTIEFFYRTVLPGTIIESNAVRDLDGSLLWRFSNRDVILAGYRMWARTLVLNTDAIDRLQLRDFPKSLATVETLYEALMTPRRKIDPNRIELLRRCVELGDLRPLREAANPLNAGRGPVFPEDAQRLLGILGAFHDPSYRPGPERRPSGAPLPGPVRPPVRVVEPDLEPSEVGPRPPEENAPAAPRDTRPAPAPLPPPEI